MTRTSKPPGVAELEALAGSGFVLVDDVERAIKVMSSGAPRPRRSREPDEYERFLAALIDHYRYRQEVAAAAGDEVADDEFDVAWRDLCEGPVLDPNSDRLPSLKHFPMTRDDNVRFLLEHIREQRRQWLLGIPRMTYPKQSER